MPKLWCRTDFAGSKLAVSTFEQGDVALVILRGADPLDGLAGARVVAERAWAHIDVIRAAQKPALGCTPDLVVDLELCTDRCVK